LPHQLYVAKQATEHTHVRALLSDEVGLGKTIEAGLIINRLKQQGRAKRILIAVPEALQAQWLVELIRRFSLYCELYQGVEHDFAIGQVHLITHRQLEDTETLTLIAEQDWDMLVVDEAHHLRTAGDTETIHWSTFAQQTAHLLLLTATPEQLGMESHFGRLQLLDAGRFASYEQYLKDEASFAELSDLANALNNGDVTDEEIKRLADLGIQWNNDADQVLTSLLDRHGTGRVVYRNTRKGVSGFHDRQAYLTTFADNQTRVIELADWLKQQKNEKVLLITHNKEDAKDIAYQLWHEHGIDATSFHEDLDLIERDRAAAHFADDEDGAQILVCSEIGGEGRNFQFCHHLILWDIPKHPDALEQRIGRLDRIGQSQTIHIHALLLEDQEDLERFNWYHQVLQCVETIQSASGAIHDQYSTQWFTNPSETLKSEIITALETLTEQLESGRDVLLELNSCRQPEANEIKERIEALEQNHPLDVVEMAANLLNLHFESISDGVYELIPSSNMLIPTLPGIPEGGAVVTFDRSKASSREDTLFLSWEHPFIQGLADVLHGTELGQASLALLETQQVPAGQLLMEVQWSLSLPERFTSALRPHLDEALFRTLVLEGGEKDLNDVLPEAALQAQVKALPVKVARKMIRQSKERINPLYDASQKLATERFANTMAALKDSLSKSNTSRIERLEYLEKINPLVTAEDVTLLKQQTTAELAALEQCEFVTSGVRLILCAPPGSL
jgi:ATP-dependent helicase HepA